MSIELVVEISPDVELAHARVFYEHAFGVTRGGELDDGRVLVVLLGSTRLLLMHGPVDPDPFYEKGLTPRLELVVEGVDEWLQHAEAAGAQLLFRLRSDGTRCQEPGEPAVYAHVLDRFGHLWALAEADPPA